MESGDTVIGQWPGSDSLAATRQKSSDLRECQAVSSLDEGRLLVGLWTFHPPPAARPFLGHYRG